MCYLKSLENFVSVTKGIICETFSCNDLPVRSFVTLKCYYNEFSRNRRSHTEESTEGHPKSVVSKNIDTVQN